MRKELRKKEDKKKESRKKQRLRILPALFLVGAGASLWWLPGEIQLQLLTLAERRLDASINQCLVENGFQDENVISTTRRERREGTVQWIETTREIKIPGKVKLPDFRNKITSSILKANCKILRDATTKNIFHPMKWVIEAGRGPYVLQKLTFHR